MPLTDTAIRAAKAGDTPTRWRTVAVSFSW